MNSSSVSYHEGSPLLQMVSFLFALLISLFWLANTNIISFAFYLIEFTQFGGVLYSELIIIIAVVSVARRIK